VAEDIIFPHHDIVLNHVPRRGRCFPGSAASDPHESEVMELIIHEQYFYPEYRGYEPTTGSAWSGPERFAPGATSRSFQ
jgi:hypothetical protein